MVKEKYNKIKNKRKINVKFKKYLVVSYNLVYNRSNMFTDKYL